MDGDPQKLYLKYPTYYRFCRVLGITHPHPKCVLGEFYKIKGKRVQKQCEGECKNNDFFQTNYTHFNNKTKYYKGDDALRKISFKRFYIFLSDTVTQC